MAAQFESKKNHWLKRKIIMLGSLTVTTFLLIFILDTFTSYSPIKLIENGVKKVLINKKNSETGAHFNSKDPYEKVIYLTFDDGPSSVTDDILDVLQKNNATATFFMLSPYMKERPNTVERMIKEGHSVGLHGVTHDVNHFYHSKETVFDEINEAQEVLESITGIHSVLIRTTYVSVTYLNEPFRKALNTEGYRLWDWNVDSRDWELADGKYVKSFIDQIESLEERGVTPVVLLHDQPKTAKYLPQLMTYLANQGYQIKKLDDSVEPVIFECADRCYAINN